MEIEDMILGKQIRVLSAPKAPDLVGRQGCVCGILITGSLLVEFSVLTPVRIFKPEEVVDKSVVGLTI